MKIAKFAKLVKNSGYCYVAHVAGSGIWLGTNTAMYRATELPELEGREQVRTVLDMSEKDFKKVHLVEIWADGLGNVSGMNLSPYDKEQETEKLKVITAPKGIWCACRRCREDGELFFYDEVLLLPLMDELKKATMCRTPCAKARMAVCSWWCMTGWMFWGRFCLEKS